MLSEPWLSHLKVGVVWGWRSWKGGEKNQWWVISGLHPHPRPMGQRTIAMEGGVAECVRETGAFSLALLRLAMRALHCIS